jgi:hypothetical protein
MFFLAFKYFNLLSSFINIFPTYRLQINESFFWASCTGNTWQGNLNMVHPWPSENFQSLLKKRYGTDIFGFARMWVAKNTRYYVKILGSAVRQKKSCPTVSSIVA